MDIILHDIHNPLCTDIDMLKYYGITEVSGCPGTGKTAILMEEARKYRTIYITATTFCFRRYEDASFEEKNRVIVRYISNMEHLASFIMNGMEVLVRKLEIELIIIDGLDNFLEVEKRNSRIYNLVFNIINRLKRFNQKYLTNVLVSTCNYGKWIVESLCIGNPLLGLNWMYMVNTKYICSNTLEERILKLVSSPMNDECEWRFRIGPHRVTYFEKFDP